jgi:hypothetical protein
MALVNPMANYLPAGWLRGLLRFGKSELAAANWGDPGGWRSMVITYEATPRRLAAKVLGRAGAMPVALRNRRRLAGAVLADQIDRSPSPAPHVLCLGAGPGYIIADALLKARKCAHATLVDLSGEAFEFGQRHARQLGLADRMTFIQGDARDIHALLDQPPDVVKMLGLCEYLTDEQIVTIVTAIAGSTPPGTPLVTNTLSAAHGTDRFFRRVFGLHMNHLDACAIGRLLNQAGFEQTEALAEPLGVYHVIVARRR